MNKLSANTTIKVGSKPMILMPLEEYEYMRKEYEEVQEDLEMAQSITLARKVTKAREQIKNGEVYTTKEVEKTLGL